MKPKYIERIGALENIHPLVARKNSISITSGSVKEIQTVEWVKSLNSADMDAALILFAAAILFTSFTSQALVVHFVYRRR